ncbi:flagellar basal body-associated FliL family protein [Paracoccus albus]|uniref:flagellar basal body-associated FliL family protein n=1 Tax=Paracoccus albus TaxID=3017784 RepID=UPI0022F05FFA|nr:flagellar basal body-associated FliL family protein [Paracoccus albus]WBU60208.1 flagellar basal body-associated FliL family protein [Paracoccus albus]
MADTTKNPSTSRGRGRPALIMAALLFLAGAGSFAAAYAGLVSPLAMLRSGEMTGKNAAVGFVEVPRIMVPMLGGTRQIVLSVKLEAEPERVAAIKQQMPRILDSFNLFLSNIAPAAIDRRGVLEIIRTELQTRIDMLLGEVGAAKVLITEFAIQ